MCRTPLVRVAEPGRLGGLIVLDGHTITAGQADGILGGDGGGPSLPLAEGQRPVVSVGRDTQPDLTAAKAGDVL